MGAGDKSRRQAGAGEGGPVRLPKAMLAGGGSERGASC